MKTLTVMLGVGALYTALPVQAQTFSISTGAEFTTGDYGGGADTDVFYAPIALGLDSGEWSIRASIPYLELSGPGVFLGEDLPLVRDVAAPVRMANEEISGFGDLSLRITKTTRLDAEGKWELDLTGRVKLPTADNMDGLGTGETDYAASADLIRNVGAWSWFAGGGYRVNGDPEGRDLNDIAFGSLGAVRYTQAGSSWGVAYDYSQAASDGVDDAHELSTWLSFGLTSDVRLQLYGLTGLSDGGPDYGGGARMVLTL
ncbi:MAG: hypothetical protein HRT82_05740 [Henriciella sp.]|nr:hypothetical protein [Henriciella sp.]